LMLGLLLFLSYQFVAVRGSGWRVWSHSLDVYDSYGSDMEHKHRFNMSALYSTSSTVPIHFALLPNKITPTPALP
jgi:hypothetical protein